MSPTADYVRDLLLREAGFLKDDGKRRPGLLDSVDAQEQVDTSLRYGSLFGEMGNASSIPDLIYETPGGDRSPGRPCGYLKVLSHPSSDRIADLRRRLWNHGRIPTLWIITPGSVRIYNAFARPREQAHQDVESHLLGELRLLGNQLTEVDKFHRRTFDDGSFWRAGEGKRIDATQRVDQALLEDLQDTDTLLRQQKSFARRGSWIVGPHYICQIPRRSSHPPGTPFPSLRKLSRFLTNCSGMRRMCRPSSTGCIPHSTATCFRSVKQSFKASTIATCSLSNAFCPDI